MDKLVSPSQWSERPNVIEEHVAFVTKESEKVHSSILDHATKYYGNRPSNKLEIFGLSQKNKGTPIFVYISGGYWQELSGDISLYPVQPQFDEGISSIIVDYSRAPIVTMQDIVEEIIEASKLILDIALEHKTKSIILAGHSAGGQLCSMVLTSDWFASLPKPHRSMFKAVFHLSGVFRLKPLLKTYVNDKLQMDEELAERLSPLSLGNLRKLGETALPHTFIIAGEKDSPLFIEQAKEFTSEMIKMSNIQGVTFQIIPQMDHFNLVENLCSKNYTITKNILYLINNYL
uniref:Probable arylformamidase n=1 Tax=Caligus clemensi TaxID=344056 RepID=C1C0C1_CALCM|nr:Probable arylformamidase [Caligus clemensi]